MTLVGWCIGIASIVALLKLLHLCCSTWLCASTRSSNDGSFDLKALNGRKYCLVVDLSLWLIVVNDG
jgi:hypothetical protein